MLFQRWKWNVLNRSIPQKIWFFLEYFSLRRTLKQRWWQDWVYRLKRWMRAKPNTWHNWIFHIRDFFGFDCELFWQDFLHDISPVSPIQMYVLKCALFVIHPRYTKNVRRHSPKLWVVVLWHRSCIGTCCKNCLKCKLVTEYSQPSFFLWKKGTN